MKMKAKVARSGGFLYVWTPFDQDYVDALKQHVGSRKRRWMPEAKLWRIDESYEEVLLHLLDQYFGGYEFANFRDWTDSSPGPSVSAQIIPAYSRLHLLPTAPPEVITAAYRALAKMHHPDCGGDTATMQAINSAYEQICQVG